MQELSKRLQAGPLSRERKPFSVAYNTLNERRGRLINNDSRTKLYNRRNREFDIFTILLVMGIIAIVINPFSIMVTWIVVALIEDFSSICMFLIIPLIILAIFLFVKAVYGEIDLVPFIILGIISVMFYIGGIYIEGDATYLVYSHIFSLGLGVLTFVLSIYFSKEVVDEPMSLPMFIGLLAIFLNVILIALYL